MAQNTKCGRSSSFLVTSKFSKRIASPKMDRAPLSFNTSTQLQSCEWTSRRTHKKRTRKRSARPPLTKCIHSTPSSGEKSRTRGSFLASTPRGDKTFYSETSSDTVVEPMDERHENTLPRDRESGEHVGSPGPLHKLQINPSGTVVRALAGLMVWLQLLHPSVEAKSSDVKSRKAVKCANPGGSFFMIH